MFKNVWEYFSFILHEVTTPLKSLLYKRHCCTMQELIRVTLKNKQLVSQDVHRYVLSIEFLNTEIMLKWSPLKPD